MVAAETLPIRELEEHRRTLADLGTVGGFRKVREVVGTAAPAPHGALRSALTERRFEPAGPQHTGPWRELLHGGPREETLGFEYTEWVIRPGQRLYVLGEVHDRTGPLVVGKPEAGADPFVISTRTEDELRAAQQGRQRLFAWGGAALGGLGLVLAVLGAVL